MMNKKNEYDLYDKFELRNLSKQFEDHRSYIFVSGLGFDQRCWSILEAMKIRSNIVEYRGILNIRNQEPDKTKERFESLLGDRNSTVIQYSDYIMGAVRNILDIFGQDQDNDIDQNYIIDITAFSHELLLAFIALLKHQDESILSRITFLYLGAEKYGDWLSAGVQNIRSVIGYPGSMDLSKRSHLVIMLGFEVERAKTLITQYEPHILSIGKGSELGSISPEHYKENVVSFERIKEFLDEIKNNQYVKKFQFSCKDPIETQNALKEHLDDYQEYNNIICPLNTKISTLGCALYAFDNKDVQLCYPDPVEYNTRDYVEPDDKVLAIRLRS